MRWLFGGRGPGYCKAACERKPGVPTSRCDECLEPNLLPETLPALRLFDQAWTQRRFAPNGLVIGFDYQGVKAAAELMGLSDVPQLFDWFAAMEQVMTTIFIEKYADDQKD